MERVIINADDFGLTDSVNEAIINIFKAGNLTSTTMMVNTPGFSNGVELAKANPDLGIGLHFCLTEGKPLTKADTLTDTDGDFYARGVLIKRILKGKVSKAEIKEEFKAQLKKLIEAGISPTHTDSHQHIMMIPFVFNAVIDVIKENNLPVRIVEPNNIELKLAAKRPKKFVLQVLNKIMSGINRGKVKGHVLSNGMLTSVHELNSLNQFDVMNYLELVRKNSGSEVLELMVHPYTPHEDLKEWYGQTYESKRVFLELCEKEYKTLSGKPMFKDYQLITFKDI